MNALVNHKILKIKNYHPLKIKLISCVRNSFINHIFIAKSAKNTKKTRELFSYEFFPYVPFHRIAHQDTSVNISVIYEPSHCFVCAKMSNTKIIYLFIIDSSYFKHT